MSSLNINYSRVNFELLIRSKAALVETESLDLTWDQIFDIYFESPHVIKYLNIAMILLTKCFFCFPDTQMNSLIYRKVFSKVFSLSQSSWHITNSKKN